MFKILGITTIFFFNVGLLKGRDIFDETADSLFDSIIGDVYNTNRKMPVKDVLEIIKKNNKTDLFNTSAELFSDSKVLTTTERIILATKHIKKAKASSFTMEDFNIRKMNMNIGRLLSNRVSPIPDFANDADNPSLETRRFEMIRKKVRDHKPVNILRQEYFEYENATQIYRQKNKTISLMEHYIYETRYKLSFSQRMRHKYRNNLRYQIGYCLASLRQLLQQQMMIYSSYSAYYLKVSTLQYHMKLYEKVVRLNVDIRDMSMFVRALERERKRIYEPNYYNDYEDEDVNSTTTG